MVSIVFWGIVALIIILCKSEGLSAALFKFLLVLGICIALTAYGISTDSTALIVIFGLPLLVLVIAIVVGFIALTKDD